MIIDATAQRYSTHDGQPLVDYLPVLLPCQILTVDSLVVVRRELPSPVEFVLKSCNAGLDNIAEIAAFLGFSDRFMELLIEQMKADEMIDSGIDGCLRLLKRGKVALQQNGDSVHIDKTISVLWDPVTESPITKRQEVFSERSKQSRDRRIRFPAVLRVPQPDELDVKTIQAYRRSVRELDETDDREDILRFVNNRRVLHRYRRAILLIYENGKSDPVIKLAIDGQIDEQLSSAFALKDGGHHVGVDPRFYRRAGSVAVETRQRGLSIKTASGKNHEVLLQRRVVLNWHINSITPRLAEDDATQKVREQYAQYVEELKFIEAELETIPVRQVSAAEMTLCLKEAFVHAKQEIIVTTTLPNGARFSKEIERSLEAALQRGVKVRIYVADRVEDSAPASRDSGVSPIARLNALVERHPSYLEIRFLRTVSRPVLEIWWDGMELVFANDSPLGERPEPQIPRAFRGIRVSDEHVVKEYSTSYLNFRDEDFVKKVERAGRSVSNRKRSRSHVASRNKG